MNSILLTHVTPAMGEARLHTALSCLGTYLDNEVASLEAILALGGQKTAIDDIRALHTLHLDPDATASEVRQLLAHAHAALERLMARVHAIPLEAAFERAPSDFDAWHRWSGARLQDISTTLSDAIAL